MKLRRERLEAKKRKVQKLLDRYENYQRVLEEILNGKKTIRINNCIVDICAIKPKLKLRAIKELHNVNLIIILLKRMVNTGLCYYEWSDVALKLGIKANRLYDILKSNRNNVNLNENEMKSIKEFLSQSSNERE